MVLKVRGFDQRPEDERKMKTEETGLGKICCERISWIPIKSERCGAAFVDLASPVVLHGC